MPPTKIDRAVAAPIYPEVHGDLPGSGDASVPIIADIFCVSCTTWREGDVDWFTAAGEIYHRSCAAESRWTHWREPTDGKCAGCGESIPEDVLSVAKTQVGLLSRPN